MTVDVGIVRVSDERLLDAFLARPISPNRRHGKVPQGHTLHRKPCRVERRDGARLHQAISRAGDYVGFVTLRFA
jgi:hypothetical protein